MQSSMARSLFDRITATGEDAAIRYLESLITSPEKTFEDQYLDFKGGRANNVEEIWSKQLSGFANTGGGVVVWGIKTQKLDGIDFAGSLDKLPNPLSLKAELEKHLQHATDPPIAGVEIIPVPSSGEPGFLVCYIPESSYKPHRALKCQGHPYYGRFSHRTELIPTAWLRQLFQPQRTIRLTAQLNVAASDGDESKWQINGYISNQGPVTAQTMFLRVVSNRLCKFHAMDGWQLVNQDKKGRKFERGSDGYDYVTERDYFADMRRSEPLHPGHETWSFQIVEVRGLVKSGMNVEVFVYSQDQSPVAAKLDVEAQIHEDILRITKDGTRAIIQLSPQELLQVT